MGLAAAAGCASKRVLATDEAPATPVAAEAPATLATGDAPALSLSLKVGLAEGVERVVLTATGACELRGGTDRRQLLAVVDGRAVSVRRSEGRVRWSSGSEGGTADAVALVPRGAGTLVEWKDSAWRGALSVIPTRRGRGLSVVNELDLEEYLRGVVPGEIGRPDADALAAVEAQAVAARTYAVSHRGSRSSQGFDLYASVMDQVYEGVKGEHATADAAVAGTAGLVLTVRGEPVNAYYHANCGGCSEVPDAVWPRPAEEFLVVCEDRAFPQGECFCAGGRYATWEQAWAAADLSRILRKSLPEYLDYMAETAARSAWAGDTFTPRGGANPRAPGALRDLRIRARTASGRVAWLDVETDAGTYHVRGDRVRWVLAPGGGNPAILRSAWFDLDLRRREGRIARVVARGRGFGHGIGMCQHGALARARAGQDFRAILAHYYPGATVAPLTTGAAP